MNTFPKQKTQQQLQAEVDEFNQKFKAGQMVNVLTDSGETVVDHIRYEASIMGGHTAVAWLEIKGSYILERVTAV